MFCSTIIPTIGRPTLSRAINSVLNQEFVYDDFEVIVVNDSGRAIPESDWQKSDKVRIVHTNRRERSVARNTGAAIARGKYLHFLDDDDWLLPGALENFWQLAQRSNQAIWLYGGIRVVNNSGQCLAEMNSSLNGDCFAPIMGGAWAPIQTSLIEHKAFFTAGGFDPLITVTEDLDLCRRVAYLGQFANTLAVVACLLRDVSWGSSSDYDQGPDKNRDTRDRVLSQPGVFARLRASARSSYWHGRILHIYISAVMLNLRCWRLFTAVSRAIFSLVVFVLAGPHFFSANFWQAVKDDQVPNSLQRTLEASKQDLYKDKI